MAGGPAAWLRRLTRRGFVGPRFEGLRGRLRFVFQELVVRRDIVMVATPRTAVSPSTLPSGLELEVLRDFASLAPVAGDLDADYFPGFSERFREPFSWGETLVLLKAGGRVVGFCWYQRGTESGVRYYAGTLLEGDCRILRVGVLPSQRRRGYGTALYVLLLDRLFREGALRVFIDVSKDNIPSVRSMLAAGYRPIRELTVLGGILGRFIRWEG